MNSDPRGAYTERLEARRQTVERHGQRHRTIGNLRLLVFTSAAIMAWLIWGRGLLSAFWLGLPAAVFVCLIVAHERVLRARRAAGRAVAHYERALARLDGQWAGHGETGARFLDGAHPYAADLDLFGPASLFELLSTARTRMGEETLAHWLLEPGEPAGLRVRHEAVAELRPMLDLREDLAVLGEDVRTGVHPAELAAWGDAARRSLANRAAPARLPLPSPVWWPYPRCSGVRWAGAIHSSPCSRRWPSSSRATGAWSGAWWRPWSNPRTIWRCWRRCSPRLERQRFTSPRGWWNCAPHWT